MAFSVMSEQSSFMQDSFMKPQHKEQLDLLLELDESIKTEPINFLSFCPFEWQSMLLALGTTTELHILKVILTDELLERQDRRIATSILCSFHTKTKVTSLSWSPETSENSPIKISVLVSLHAEGSALCLWDGKSSTAHIQHISGHKGPVSSVHIEPLLGESWASVGYDNLLNVYDSQGEIRAQKVLRTAGKYVRFLENEIMVVELNGTIRFYDVPTVRPLRTAFYRAPLPVKLDCVNGTFACVNARGTLGIYRHSDKPPHEFPNAALCSAMSLSSVGPWCAIACGSVVRVVHIQNGQIIHQSNLHSIRSLCWHPTRPYLCVAHGNQINLYRIQ